MSIASRFSRFATTPLILGASAIGLSALSQQVENACSVVGAPHVDAPSTSEELSLLQRTGAGRSPAGEVVQQSLSSGTSRGSQQFVLEAADMLPKPLREEDLRSLQMLNNTEGEELSRSHVEVPADWAGPLPPPPLLWGGPPPLYAAQVFGTKAIPSDTVELFMNFAGPGSGIPEDMQGIWWMDQYGASIVAQDPEYPFLMIGTPEVLASFGTASTPPGPGPGTHLEAESNCITPVTLYGGRQWAATDDSTGSVILASHINTRNSLSFCFTDADTIQIYQKMLTEQASIGPFLVGPDAAEKLGFVDAGGGYSWVPLSIMNMTMKRMSWGWDRVTTVGDWMNQFTPIQERILKAALPPSVWKLFKLGQKLQTQVVSHYPLIQIVDGEGERTQYYDQYLQWMHSREYGGKTILMTVAKDEAEVEE